MPPNIENSPMKRNCPSDISVILRKVSRHTEGAKKGKTPSITSINATAANRFDSTVGLDYLPGDFKYLKNSELGSSTITSLLFLNV